MSTEMDQLRHEIREWLQHTVPLVKAESAAERDPEIRSFAARRRYGQALCRDGWAGLAWPIEWGGRGGGYRERLVFAQEAAAAGAPDPLHRLGVDIIGPAIDVLGTPEQKRRLLPPILRGEAIWCQGFSEPDAGSDLASLKTRAVPAASGWRISGQKVWTSFGQYADQCVVLARTDPDARPHAGISAFVVPMDAPGIEARPIPQITGGADFCEVFLTDVEVPAENLIGEQGGGWRFAMTALGFERSINFMGRQVALNQQVERFIEQIRARSTRVPSRLKDAVVMVHARSQALQATVEANMAVLDDDGDLGTAANASKVFWSETFQSMADLGAEMQLTVQGFGEQSERDWLQEYLVARSTTIYAGTSEIQRNIIAERGLGLPR